MSTPALADAPAADVAINRSGDRTLESVVVEALQPMLNEWLDANLPRLLEDRLKDEIERRLREGGLKS